MSFLGGNIPMEYLMCGAIGFLAAWLLALLCLPAVHNRAQRLLRKRYDELPLSLQEMRAEKDQIRAGFAAATRDLEVSISKLKEKTSIHATDISKKIQLIERLKQELEQQNAALEQSIVRERQARDELHVTRQEFDSSHAALAYTTERERAVVPNYAKQGASLHLKTMRSMRRNTRSPPSSPKSPASRRCCNCRQARSRRVPQRLYRSRPAPQCRQTHTRRTAASRALGPRSMPRRAGSTRVMTVLHRRS
jgi:hypothetical protein